MNNLVAMDTYCQVFGHLSFFHCFNTNRFECIGEINQGLVFIQFATESQSTCPCKNGCDRIGAGGFSFLMITVVAGYSPMCGF